MPLSNLRVLELAGILAGPLVGQFCAELGAEVIKVEPPERGDPTRGWYLPDEDRTDDVSAYFSCANHGKRSIALDLRDREDRTVARKLARTADVVIAAYKPGDDVRFELDNESLRRSNPRLIYVQVTAYGQADPRPGFDAIVQAEGGFTFLNGEAEGAPLKMPVALVDVLAAHQLKQGLLLALMRLTATGRGAHVSTSLLGAATASLANQAANYLRAGVVPRRLGSDHPNIVPYGTSFATADGRELVLGVGTDKQFGKLMQTLGKSEVAGDPRFATNAARVENREVLNELLRRQLAGRTSDEIEPALRAAKVPFGFVNDMQQVFAQPESKRQLLDDGRGVRTVALDGDIEGCRAIGPPPHLDQHGEAIRLELEEESR